MNIKLLFVFLLFSCANTDNNEARDHFVEIKQILDTFFDAKHDLMGDLKAHATNDSIENIRVSKLLNDFNKISNTTLRRLNGINSFDDFDLKNPSVEYVKKITGLINLTIREAMTHRIQFQKSPDEFTKWENMLKMELHATERQFESIAAEFKAKYRID